MLVFFAITTTVIFQLGFILFCFKVKQIKASSHFAV
jgi:hypothetical protein